MNPKLKLLSSALFSVALASSLPAVATQYDNQPLGNAVSDTQAAAESRTNVVESETSDAMDDARQKRLDAIEADTRDQRDLGTTGAIGTRPGTTPGTAPSTSPGTTPGTPGMGNGTQPGNAAGSNAGPRPGSGGATAP